MGSAKTEEFTARAIKVARYAKAMAHPARIAILNMLLKKQSCICGDIVEGLPLSQSTVSQHLKELKDAGLINGAISGTRVCYCIDEKEWRTAKMFFESFLKPIPNINCCK
jgi:DNA-binding transcriptional ArsR family regulator